MHDKHLHIDNSLESNYPVPGIPVDEAWEFMRKMLDADIQTSSDQKSPAIRNTIWNYGLIFILITTILTWIINSNRKDVVQITKHKENNNEQINKPAIKDEHQSPENDLKNEITKKDSIGVNAVVSNQQYKTNDSAKEAQLSPGLSSGTNQVTDTRTKKNNNITSNNKMNSTGKSSLESGNLASRNKPILLKDHSPKDPSAVPTIPDQQVKQKKGTIAKDAGYNISGKNERIKREKEKKEYVQVNAKSDQTTAAKNKNVKRVEQQGTVDIKKNTERTQLKTGSQDPLKPKGSIFNTKPAITRFTFCKDSAVTAKNKKVTDKKRANTLAGFSFGLQWNVPAPLQGTSYYFTAADGKLKPYTLLFPELWISKVFDQKKNKHRIQLLLNPNQQYFTGNKEIVFYSGPQSVQDTTPVTKSTKLLKTSGIGSTLQYNYNLNIKWSAGIGINYGLYGKALTHTQTIRKMDNSLLSDSLFGITKSSAHWNYIYQSLFTGKIEIVYSFKRFQSGAAIFIPFNNISASPKNNIRPLNGEFFLRFKLK